MNTSILRRSCFFVLVAVLALGAAACSDRTARTALPKPLAAASAAESPLRTSAAGLVARTGGVSLTDPALQPTEALGRFTTVSVSFSAPMVAAADLDRPVAVPPVEIVPDVATRFRWRTPTEGELTVTEDPRPNTPHRLRLRAEARDLAGAALRAPDWGVRWPEAWFTVRRAENYSRSDDYDDALPAEPRLDLEFSHPVAAEEVARTVIWRDEQGATVSSRVRLPADVEPARATRVEVAPRRPLAPGHRYDLIVEDTRSALGGARLAYVHAFPVGATQPLVLESVAGFNQPREGAFIEARFNQVLDAASVAPGRVRVVPAVADLRVETAWSALRLRGDFDRTVRYRVEIDAGIRSQAGFALAEAATWHASFGAKRAAVVLPRSIVTTTARQGLALELTQVNTAALRWRLARVPDAALFAARRRLDEYRDLDVKRRDPLTNEFRLQPTERLVEALRLPVVAEGAFEASGADREVARTIEVPAAQLPAGTYLCEIDGLASDGRIAGNRALVFVNREFLAWKSSADGLLARLFDVGDGAPVPGATVELFASDGAKLAAGETDAAGELRLAPWTRAASPELAVVTRAAVRSAHFAEFTGGLPWLQPKRAAAESDDARVRHWLFNDRGIYRPGETVRVKGVVRDVGDAGRLAVPDEGTAVAWQLLRGWKREPVLEGEGALSATGAWELAMPLPASLPVGEYTLRALGAECPVKVDEFRAPAFGVDVQPRESADATASRVRVVSRYFHGAPNARATVRWRAIWSAHHAEADDGARNGANWITTGDWCAPDRELVRPAWARAAGASETGDEPVNLFADGSATLDADGTVELAAPQPFPAKRRVAAAAVRWEVSVVAADGQTADAEARATLALAPAQPGVAIRAAEQSGAVEVWATALRPDGALAAGQALRLELFRVEEKSVREDLSARVVRFRNTPVFTPVLAREVAAPFRETLPVPGAGRYVAVVALAGGANPPRAADDTIVSGPEPVEFAQWDDANFEARPERREYAVGETARIVLRAPFAGPAWVTVETDRVLQSRFVRLDGNAATIEVPVTAEMHPNATVAVLLFRPENLGAPAERFAECTVRVRRPETELRVATELAQPQVEPGATVRGAVTVRDVAGAAGGAEIALFAVDEAVLSYGRWRLPDAAAVFFPPNDHTIGTRSGLRQFGPRREDEPLFQKGFLIGGGGASRSAAVRRNFAALAFWSGAVRTDAAGRAEFSFPAPDNLTAYRIVAVAHRGAEQFGAGARHVEVARRLQVEPALPRFARQGDEVELRALVRQREWSELRGRVDCAVTGATLLGPGAVEFAAARGLPQVVVFRARVAADASELRGRFAAAGGADGGVHDGVELTLPVRAARIERHGAVAGALPAGAWTPALAAPAAWREGAGTADVIVSATPWLPVLDGLPRLLDYPHGCNEQVSSRVLSFALMGDLLEGLPDRDARWPEYRRRVEEGLARLARAQLGDGAMPYWPGQRTPHAFVTIQTAWAAQEAQRSGFRVPESFVGGLKTALTRLARRQDGVRAPAELRAFALLVLASLEPGQKLRADALELFEQRDALGDDGRAFLALALHRWRVMPAERARLLAELGTTPVERTFEPATFGSAARTEALRLWARAEAGGAAWSPAERAAAETAATRLSAGAADFSTQENLWSLLAVRALVKRAAVTAGEDGASGGAAGTAAEAFAAGDATALHSPDRTAAGWYERPLAGLFSTDGDGRATRPVASVGGGSFLLRAHYRLAGPEVAEDRGFRVERIVRNLTEARRDGSAAAPFALGDELLVTFRVATARAYPFVALTESLPAAFETVDPDYLRTTLKERLDAAGAGWAALSHWEKRDDRTLWYFDDVPAGVFSYATVVRVTSAGRWQWPGATVETMYDARFGGVGAAATIEVK